MKRQDEPVRRLTDLNGNEIGQVAVEGTEDDTVIGRFTPGPAYPQVERLFREFAEAVDSQALSRVDRLDAEIARLGLRLRPPSGESIRIYDVQLWDSERITYKMGHAAEIDTDAPPVPSRRQEPVATSEHGRNSASEGSRPDEVLDEAMQGGTALYEKHLRAELERDFMGQMVAIHPGTGEYVVAEREEDAVSELRLRQPEGVFFVRRIGPPTPGDLRLATRLDGISDGHDSSLA